MTAKEQESMQDILDNSSNMSVQEYADEVYIMSKCIQGMAECQRGEGIPHEQVMKEMQAKWLS